MGTNVFLCLNNDNHGICLSDIANFKDKRLWSKTLKKKVSYIEIDCKLRFVYPFAFVFLKLSVEKKNN